MKKQIWFVIGALMSVTAQAAELDGMADLLSGKAEYYCAINRQNPKIKNQYDQKVYYGAVVLKDGSGSIIVTPKGKVYAEGLGQIKDPREMMAANGSMYISVRVTSLQEAGSEAGRNLTLAVGRLVFTRNPSAQSAPEVFVSGFYQGQVQFMDSRRNLSVVCGHRSQLGLR